METRSVKIIRWILLFPLTFAVPTFVHLWLSDKVNIFPINIHLSLYSIWGLAPLTALSFIPALLTVPTACVIAPAHQKKVSIITLIVAALFWFLAFVMTFSLPATSSMITSPLQKSNAILIVTLCAQLMGLLAGFLVVRSVLKKREKGEPFLKSSATAIILIICLASIPLCFPKKIFFETELSELTWKEDAGVVSYSFKLENRTGQKNDIAVELAVMDSQSSTGNNNVVAPPLERIHIEVSLAPKEIKTITGQFAAEGYVWLIPFLTKSDTTGSTTSSR